MTNQTITTSITASSLDAKKIEAGHIAIGTWNGKTGAESRLGVKHLYSDSYRERWPRDQYPEKYEQDVDCNAVEAL